MSLDYLRKIAETYASTDREIILTASTALALLDRVEKAERRVSRLKNREQKSFGKLRESRAALQRVRELHTRDDGYCRACDRLYPCPTIRALEGDE